MTTQPQGEPTETAGVEPITDPESLRDRDDVPFHEDTDVVDAEMLDLLEDLDDMAPVGVTNDDGEVLVMRVDEDCNWKIPSPEVAPGEEFGAAAREWVETNTGLAIELDGLEGVWRFEASLEDGERTASRYFVVFSASPASDGATLEELHDEVPDEDAAEEAGWFDELPEDAGEPPGSRLFFD